MQSRIPTSVAAVALFFLPLLFLFSGVMGGFVWDDKSLLASTVWVKPSGLLHIWTSPYALEKEEHYWPVLYTAFWFQERLWSFGMPEMFRLTNLFLHAANCLLLWSILRKVAVPGSWIVSAVFAVHPVHVESVTWIIELKDCLSAFFYFCSWLLFLRHQQDDRRILYSASLLCFAAGLLSKTMIVSLPVTILLGIWYSKGSISRRDVRKMLPFFILGMAVALADVIISRKTGSAMLPYTLLQRLGIAGTSVWFYLYKSLCPVTLLPIYPKWPITLPLVISALVGLVLVFAICFFISRRGKRGPLAAAAYFVVTLAPVLGLVPFSFMQYAFVADRYLYLASVAPIALCVGVFLDAVGRIRSDRLQGILFTIPFVLILALGLKSFQQAALWQNDEKLFSHVLQYNPKAWIAHQMLALSLAKSDPGKALSHMKTVRDLNPGDPMSYRNVAALSMRLNDRMEAVQAVQQGLALFPQDERLLSFRQILRQGAGNAP